MEESILTSIKKLLGIAEEYTQFDTDLIIHINTVLSVLGQIGVGVESRQPITDKNTTWESVIGTESKLDMVKSYVYLKVKLLFDPPQSSAVLDTINRNIGELEWRIFVETDPEIPNDTAGNEEG